MKNILKDNYCNRHHTLYRVPGLRSKRPVQSHLASWITRVYFLVHSNVKASIKGLHDFIRY